MRVIRPAEVPEQPDSNPLFIGAVTRQPLVSQGQSANYTLAIVNFAPGARNKFHRHSGDQVLFVTHGTGIIATEQEREEIHMGELAFIPAGEKHWHGATEHSAFSHISLTPVGSTTETLE